MWFLLSFAIVRLENENFMLVYQIFKARIHFQGSKKFFQQKNVRAKRRLTQPLAAGVRNPAHRTRLEILS